MNEREERDALEAGLSAAFGQNPPTVLTQIEKRTGDAPRVTLRDADSDAVGTPVMDPSSEEVRALPRGRGNYQLMGELARGGMGVILRGHDTDLGRDVAVKVLSKELRDRPEILKRFVEEAQIGGQLQHPGIVPVYELGLMADERPYFTMKLVKGKTLSALLAARENVGTDRRRLLDVFLSVCQTVAYAHSRGVIHRDLKPSNIMVGAFGEVQVVDWGLAKVLQRSMGGDAAAEKRTREERTVLDTVRSSDASSHSMAGSVMGTPAYMPPEQARGYVEKLDESSDVFSLGAILCTLLTGAPAYEGEFELTLRQAAGADLDPALERLDTCDADEELVELAKQCLSPAQSARPANAELVAERLRRHLDSLEARTRRAEIEAAEAVVRAQEEQARARQERRVRNLAVALAGTVLVASVGFGGGWAWIQGQALERERAANARERQLAAEVSALLEDTAARRGRGEFEAAIRSAERAQALVESGAISNEWRQRTASTLQATLAARSEERRRQEFREQLLEVGLLPTPFGDWEHIDRRYREILDAHGVDIERGTPEDVARRLDELGSHADLVSVLDCWTAAGQMIDRARTERLVEIAYVLDPDPLRSDLRAAVLDAQPAVLLELSRAGLTELPAATLLLLGVGLSQTGEDEEALRVLREAVALHPADVNLRQCLVILLPGEEKVMHGPVVTALLPDNLYTFEQGVRWLERYGLDAQAAGDQARARMYFEETAARYAALAERKPDDPEVQLGFARSLKSTGQLARAARAYRRALALGVEGEAGREARVQLRELEADTNGPEHE